MHTVLECSPTIQRPAYIDESFGDCPEPHVIPKAAKV